MSTNHWNETEVNEAIISNASSPRPSAAHLLTQQRTQFSYRQDETAIDIQRPQHFDDSVSNQELSEEKKNDTRGVRPPSSICIQGNLTKLQIVRKLAKDNVTQLFRLFSNACIVQATHFDYQHLTTIAQKHLGHLQPKQTSLSV
jgi:hypothetical protein